MEYEKVFGSVAVVLVGVIAYFSLLGYWNVAYNDDVGTTANATFTHVQTLTQDTLFDLSIDVGNNTNTPSGAGSTSTNTDLVSRALSVITALPTLLGLVPALFQDFALIMGIPSAFVDIATWVFLFSFAILFAYLLIIGVRRLL